MSIKTISYLDPEGKLSPACRHVIGEKTLRDIYRAMVLVRHIDERMITLQRQGTITFAMSSAGEEAAAVASAAALEPEDWMYPQYREAGILFWRGFSPQAYIHQMFGNAEDLTLGRQMPNHFGSREHNVVTVSSPIGTKIPHAAGCAYAMKLKKQAAVTICYFGDGATSEGDFHAGVNFAAVKKVPAIFFCRNNGYAISTPCSAQFASDGIAPKGVGYGIEAIRIDGNDVFAVYETVKKARKSCLGGNGPILIEAMTYRMGAHSTSDDPSRYRKADELKEWENLCPIRRLRRYLEREKLWSEREEQALQEEIKREVDQAIEVAKKTSKPPLRTLFEDVYFEVPSSLEEQYHHLKRFFPEEG